MALPKSKRVEKLLLIPDVHVPFEDKKAVALVLRMAAKVKFDRVVTLGDTLDFQAVSFHAKTLGKRPGFAKEVKAGNELLDKIDALGIPHKHFLAGNHEYRFDRYLAEKAPELSDLPGMNVQELLRLKERGWTYTPYKSELRIGKLWLTHDEGNAGPLAAIKARNTYSGNVAIGHCHAATVSYEGNARGESHVGISCGWLGSVKNVDYLHQVKARRWQHAVGVGLVDTNGHVHLGVSAIVKGKIAVFGEIYS